MTCDGSSGDEDFLKHTTCAQMENTEAGIGMERTDILLMEEEDNADIHGFSIIGTKRRTAALEHAIPEEGTFLETKQDEGREISSPSGRFLEARLDKGREVGSSSGRIFPNFPDLNQPVSLQRGENATSVDLWNKGTKFVTGQCDEGGAVSSSFGRIFPNLLDLNQPASLQSKFIIGPQHGESLTMMTVGQVDELTNRAEKVAVQQEIHGQSLPLGTLEVTEKYKLQIELDTIKEKNNRLELDYGRVQKKLIKIRSTIHTVQAEKSDLEIDFGKARNELDSLREEAERMIFSFDEVQKKKKYRYEETRKEMDSLVRKSNSMKIALFEAERQLGQEKGKILCQKCFESRRDFICLPCRHVHFCSDCLETRTGENITCPCGATITSTLKCYL